MSYKRYKERLMAEGGGARDAITNNSAQSVDNSFVNSLGYRQVMLDGVQTDATITSAVLSDMKTILFRPHTIVERGQIVEYDGIKWIVTDFKKHEVYPKALVQRCNETLKWVDSNGISHEYPCVLNANSTLYRFGFVPDRYMNIVNNEYHVFVTLNEHTKKIKESYRLVFGDKAYVVTAVDDITMTINGVGIIRYHIKADLLRDSDDTQDNLADNKDGTQGGGSNKLW